jgi:hypothetical protein
MVERALRVKIQLHLLRIHSTYLVVTTIWAASHARHVIALSPESKSLMMGKAAFYCVCHVQM